MGTRFVILALALSLRRGLNSGKTLNSVAQHPYFKTKGLNKIKPQDSSSNKLNTQTHSLAFLITKFFGI